MLNDWIKSGSEDGKKVVYFSETEGRRKLFLRDLQSGVQKQLAPGWNISGQWISLVGNGTKVIFQGSSSGASGVYGLEVSGGAPEPLLPDTYFWCASADGRYLVTPASTL